MKTGMKARKVSGFPGMAVVVFAVVMLSGPALFAIEGTASIGLGYQLGITKNLDPAVQNGEEEEASVNHSFAFNLRYLPSPSLPVGVVLKGSVGGLSRMVWHNPAYDYIKGKTESQLTSGGSWGGFTNTQLVALKLYLPNESYTFTKDDGTLLAYDVFIGGAFEIPLIRPVSVVVDAGFVFHGRNVSYEEDLILGHTFSANVNTTTIGFGLGIGAQFAFTDMFYAELGASLTYDFRQFSSIEVKVDNTSIIDVSGKGRKASYIYFGAPYILIGVKL
ncbi:hypothetical protein FACS189468_3750 [Spirochaetia bacterium]|nr:hypothetical protein FACS189468_3750 [Spirochaetia bacterium]